MSKQYSYAKLRGRIVEKFGTIGNFAKAVGLSRQSVSNKLNCEVGFSQEDIEKWAKLLDIRLIEIGIFFFT